MTIRTHENLNPIKIQYKQEQKLDQKKIDKMEESLKKAAKNKQYQELDDIAKLPNQFKIPSITVKVIKISRTINTSRGPYQICNIKDITGNRASLNLYGDFIDKLELFTKGTFVLGYADKDFLSIDKTKTAVLESWQIPTIKISLQRYLGFCGYFRNFCEN